MKEIIEGNTAKIYESTEKKYIKLTYEDIKKESDELIKQIMEAYKVLANA
ncbi:MAG: hypothetical protein IJQ99_04845 [Synergistaceae bacterium]|nr:hypothetical protein [Synergistaceae bacterium]